MLMNLKTNDYNESVLLFNLFPTEDTDLDWTKGLKLTSCVSGCEDNDMSKDETLQKRKNLTLNIVF